MKKHSYMNTDSIRVDSNIKLKKKKVEKKTIQVLIELGLVTIKRKMEIKDSHKYSLKQLTEMAKKRYGSIVREGGIVKIVGNDKYTPAP